MRKGALVGWLTCLLSAVAVADPETYAVVDLTGKTKGFRYLEDVPAGGWTDRDRTENLVLRRVDDTLWLGVFELTERQYELVAGRRAATNANPVGWISYEDLRGAGNDWPLDAAPAPDSFLGKLRKKTGLAHFDLPTCAEWERACRDRPDVAFNDMTVFGNAHVDLSKGEKAHPFAVGSFQPNALGLYDMHGNYSEWCLDRVGLRTPQGVKRPVKGGHWRSFERKQLTADWTEAQYGWYSNDRTGARIAYRVPVCRRVHRLDVAGGGSEALTACRDRIRAMRREKTVKPEDDVEVTLAPGEYLMDGPFVLEACDGQTNGAKLVFRAARPHDVRFVGGVRLTANDFKPLSAEEAAGERFAPDCRSRIRVLDLAPHCSVLEPWKDRDKSPPPPWLYVNRRPCTLARWPNDGWLGYVHTYATGVDAKRKPVGGGAIRWEAEKSRPGTWNFEDGVWCYGYWHFGWREEFLRVASVVEAADGLRMNFAATPEYGFKPDGDNAKSPDKPHFYVVNQPRELDAPGEFWVDRKARRLYFMPEEGFGTAEIYLATGVRPMVVSQASGVVFENIDFAYSHPVESVCRLRGDGIVVRQCDFYCHGGKDGMAALSVVGRGNRVSACNVRYVGAKGIAFGGGNGKTLERGDSVVEGCEVSDYARFARTYQSGIEITGVGNVVRGCKIHDGPHLAIKFGGVDLLVTSNEIYRVLLESDDAGAFYDGRITTHLGNVFSFNHFHDFATEEKVFGKHAIYFDDCMWGGDVISNLFERVGSGVFMNGGGGRRVVGNTFVDCRTGVRIGGPLHREFGIGNFAPGKNPTEWYEKPLRTMNYLEDPWRTRFPFLATYLAEDAFMPIDIHVEGNRFVRVAEPFRYPECCRSWLERNGSIRDNVVEKQESEK